MFILGLTGGIGAGKSAASTIFKSLGVHVVDADVVAREVVQPGSATGALAQITAQFGREMLLPNGQLDRAALRQRIFANPSDKQWLNQLLHPLIRQAILAQLNASNGAYAILEAPLLIENNLMPYINKLAVVDVPEALQLTRAMQRDNNSAEQIKAIMAAQISREQRLKQADFVLDNSSTTLALQKQVSLLHQRLLNLQQR